MSTQSTGALLVVWLTVPGASRTKCKLRLAGMMWPTSLSALRHAWICGRQSGQSERATLQTQPPRSLSACQALL